MSDELKQLIEDAAKLLGLTYQTYINGKCYSHLGTLIFNPLDPERGDLMKVAEAAELTIDYEFRVIALPVTGDVFDPDEYKFTKGDYHSLALAILRAASAVWKDKND